MAVDKFNSVGGFSVGIPAVDIIDSKGNITAPSADFANLHANVGNIVNLTSNVANISNASIETVRVDTAYIDVANVSLINSANINAGHVAANSATFKTATIIDRLNAKDIYARNLYGTVHSNITAGDLQVDAADTEVIFSRENGNVRSATGSPDFTFNEATYDYMGEYAQPAKLNLQGTFNVTRVNIGTENTGKVVHEALAAKTFDQTTQVLHNISAAAIVEAVEYTIIATRTFNEVQTERHTCKIVASVLNDDIRYYEYGTAINGGLLGDFEMKFFTAGANKFIQLQVNPAYSSGVIDYKIFSTIYKG
jgi:hypothetical protein